MVVTPASIGSASVSSAVAGPHLRCNHDFSRSPQVPEAVECSPSSSLQGSSLGWLQIASMGVAIAISGNFSGWNYGLAVGGWGGMFAAATLMAVLYLGLTQIVGELA